MLGHLSRRCIWSNPRRALSGLTGVQFSKPGVPQEVLTVKSIESSPRAAGSQVKVKMLAAPINPSDLNMVEGTYGVKAHLPSFGGNEGVGVVQEVGDHVRDLKVGDWVIPVFSMDSGLGTWRQEVLAEAKRLQRVPSDIPIPYAATLAVNPCTAYRMLEDFVDLKPGDVIIQNGANSMVGMAVIQMARERGLKTINVVRSARPEIDTTLRLLSNLGGDINIPDDYLHSHAFHEILADLPPVKLGLNCVGGHGATDIARCLAKGGTMVTYGGMAKKPLKIPFDLLTSKQLHLKGFWIAEWNATHSPVERQAMLESICELIRKDQLTFFFEMHDFDDFHHALKVSLESFSLRKVVLNLDYPDRMAEHDSKTAEDYWQFEAPVV